MVIPLRLRKMVAWQWMRGWLKINLSISFRYVSMPFMGGMEATELIRSRSYEMHKGLAPITDSYHRIDSSHLMIHCTLRRLMVFSVIGDQERCLQAGMIYHPQDDHITSTHHSFKNLEYIIVVCILFCTTKFRVAFDVTICQSSLAE
ncbi:hypothetical protein BYT27DRAFT_6666787 [Phlegmacium glaucopus]|nr:hypothetical protein BYT27DRAFT_6666787 [Phlegmacium glaucopus]